MAEELLVVSWHTDRVAHRPMGWHRAFGQSVRALGYNPDMPTSRVGLSLVIGPPNAGKLGHVVSWWAERRGEHPILIAPSRPAVAALALELARRMGAVVGSRPVMTFDDLVAEVLGRTPALVGSSERLFLAATLLDRLPLQALAAISGLPGTIWATADVLAETADGGMTAEEWQKAYAAWPSLLGGERSALASDLAVLLAAYSEECCERGRMERGQALVLAKEAVQGWARPVACYGFATFTPSQRGLLSALAARTSVLLALAGEEDGSDPHSHPEVREWERAAIRVQRLAVQPQSFSSPSLAFLERVTAGGAGPPRSRPSFADGPFSGVRFLLAAGRRNEAELVAGEVVGLLRQGIPPEEIGVLVRHVGPWQELIHRVFRAAGIPYRLDGDMPFSSTGLGFALLSGLRGVAEPQAQPLLAFLRSPFSGALPEAVDAFERELLRMPGEDGAALVALARSSFPAVVQSLLQALGLDGPDGPAPEVAVDADRLRTLARRFLLNAARGAALTSVELEQDARALGAFERALGEWERHSGGPLPAELPWPGLFAALERVPVRNGGEDAAGVVHVLSVHRARARRWQVVFVLGLIDGEFPGGEDRLGLLSGAQRKALNRAAGRTVVRERRDEEDRALYAFALSRPWQLLYLSARNAEDDGGEAVVSPYWTASRQALGDPPLWRWRDLGYVVDELAVGAAAAGEADPALPASERAYLRACALAHCAPAGGAHDRLSGLPAWGRRPQRFRHPVVLAELAGRDIFSASQLEAYAVCPFGWFVDRVLRPEILDQPFDALARGRLAHDVLADVYASLEEEALLPLRPNGLARAGVLVDERLHARLADLASQGVAAERRLAGLEVREQVAAFLEAEAGTDLQLVPWQLEKVVGGKSGVDVGGLVITGRIDRVDAAPGDGPLFVIDYKTSSSVPIPPFAAKGALQVPLYQLALRRLAPDREVIGGAYVALGGEDRRGLVREEYGSLLGTWLTGRTQRVSEEELDADLDACLEAAKTAADGIRRGVVAAEAAGGCPSYCRLGPLCRSKKGR